MRCPKCKKKIEKNQKFCNYCGEEIGNQEKNKNMKILLPIGAGCICILVIVVAVVVLSKTTPASKLQAKLDLGNKYLAEANYEKAEIAFSEALKIDEKSPDAAMGLADTYNKQKKPEKAAKYLAKASDNVKNMKLSDAEEYARKLKSQEEYYRRLINDITKQDPNPEPEKQNVYVYILDNSEEVFTTPTPTPEMEATPDSTDDPDSKQDTPTPPPAGEAGASPIPEDLEVSSTPVPGNPEVNSTPAPENPEVSSTPVPENPEVDGTPTPDSPESGVSPTPDIGVSTPSVPEQDVLAEETPIPELTEIPVPEETPTPELTETLMPEETSMPEEPPMSEESISPRELLISYANEVILSQSPYASFDDSAIPYDYGNGAGSVAALNGTLGMECIDLNGDGIEELLIISMKGGKIAFDVYEAEGENVTLKGSGTADAGFESAVEGVTYSGTQECFIKENSGTYYVGLVCHYVGTNAGDGNPCTRTFAWIYSIGADGTPSGIASGSCADGADADSFSSGISPTGLSGSWASEGLDNPGLLSGGLSSVESGVEDLVIVTGSMEAGSGSMNTTIEDNTIL